MESSSDPSATTMSSTSNGTTSNPTTGSSTDPTSGVDSSSDSSASQTTEADSSSSGESGGPGLGCPETMPDAWILCEDFEDFEGWGNFWTNDGLIAVEPGPATSGDTSLRIGHDPGTFGSGMADLRFGQGPNDQYTARPDENFREVWVRFFVRTQEGWPANAGISEAVEVMSVVGGNRSIAVDATIYSPNQAQAQAIAWSCVHDSELLCSNGNGDWSGNDLRALEADLGTAPLYGDEAAGQWVCHEVHVRLDDPGQSNGVFEVFIDDELDVGLDGLEYVNAWDGAALNTVRFASFWNAPAALDHHVDDVIVSTAPIGCP